MTTLLQWDGGTLPAGITGSVTLNAGTGYPSAPSLLVAAGSVAAFVRVSPAAPSGNFRARFYIHTPTAWPSAALNVLSIRPSASTVVAGVALGGTGAPGTVRLTTTSGTTLTTSANNTLVVDKTYMFEVGYRVSDQTLWIKISHCEGVIDEVWSSTATSANFVNYDRVDIGKVNNTPDTGAFWIDSLKCTDDGGTTLIGRHPDDPWTVPGDVVGYPAEWENETTLFPVPVHMGIEQINVVSNGGYLPNNDRIEYNQTTGAVAYSTWPLVDDTPTQYLRFQHYVHMPTSWPASAYNLITLRDASSALLAACVLSGAGQPGSIRLSKVGNAAVAQSANNLLSLGKMYVAEILYDAAATRGRVAVFLPGAWQPIWDSGWITDSQFTGAISQVITGRISGTPLVSYSISAVRYDLSIAKGLMARHPGERLTVRWWNGTEFKNVSKARHKLAGGTLKDIRLTT